MMFSTVVVNAYTGPLDPDNKINFGFMIIGGKGSVLIKANVEAGFKVYFQPVAVPQTDFDLYETKKDAADKEYDAITEELNSTADEFDAIETEYRDAFDAYQALVDAGTTGQELDDAKALMETKEAAFVAADEARAALRKERAEKYEAFTTEIRPLYQSFDGADWKELTVLDTFNMYDFFIDKEFAGTKPFAAWIKLEEVNGTVSYEVAMVKVQGDLPPNVKVEAFKLDKTELSLKMNDTHVLLPRWTPANPTNKKITWKSSDEKVATVSEGGVVKGIAAGKTTITATTADGNFVANVEVTVTGVDNTKAPGKLPEAGKAILPILVVIALVSVGIIYYKKYSKFSDIK